MKRLLFAGALALWYCSGAFALQSECVLPIADGDEGDPSPPSISGVIASVDAKHITFEGREKIRIQFNKQTEIFTIHGGHVSLQQLKPGLYAFAWLVGCKPVSGDKTMAAVIQVCAKEPVPCVK
jgi:hypothetical protein